MRASHWLGLILGASLLAFGCKSGNVDIGNTCSAGGGMCADDSECPDRHICRESKDTGLKCCVRTARKCTDTDGCCPGQSCSSGRCIDSYAECPAGDSDCSGGRVCLPWTNPSLGVTKRCGYQRCGADGSCPAGLSCFAGSCVGTNPCPAGCPAGTACVPANGSCFPVGPDCAAQAQPGYTVTFTDATQIYDVCDPTKLRCQRSELPPLGPFDDLGRFASLVASPTKLTAAYYDGQYGDLVVADFDATGKQLSRLWVDGVPPGQTPVAGPSGPRGGVSEPGKDVGRYTDLALASDNTLFVSYYDVTAGDLRFAERAPDGTWKDAYTIDGASSDLGLYTSIAIDSSGKPAIAYFMKSAGTDSSITCPGVTLTAANRGLLTAVKLARATVERPSSASDWTIERVACGLGTEKPCYGCTATQTCVVDTVAASKTACRTNATTCGTGCAEDASCVLFNGNPTCLKTANAYQLAGLPSGVGLFPSLAFKGTAPVVAWYDQLAGNLVVSQLSGSTWSKLVMDGKDADGDTGDVGLYPSLVVDSSGTFLLAYQDLTRRGLRFWSGTAIAAVTDQKKPPSSAFIDTGLLEARAGGQTFVGANAKLFTSAQGTFAAYQNSTSSDLKLAKYDGSSWKPAMQWTEGAVGFYADLAPAGGKVFIVHAKIHTKLSGNKTALDNSLKLESYQP